MARLGAARYPSCNVEGSMPNELRFEPGVADLIGRLHAQSDAQGPAIRPA
jgi:hypothetical protein